jgi:hypothetical protein
MAGSTLVAAEAPALAGTLFTARLRAGFGVEGEVNDVDLVAMDVPGIQ